MSSIIYIIYLLKKKKNLKIGPELVARGISIFSTIICLVKRNMI